MVYTIEEICKNSRPVFVRHGFVKKAYLFGSYSRGEASEESDIDVFVDIEYPVGVMLFGISVYLEEVFGKKVDVLTLNEVRDIMPAVEQKGVLIYEREDKI